LSPGNKAGKLYPGTKIYDIIPSGKPYPIKSLWTLQYGLGTQMPRRNKFIKEVLPHLELFVVTEQVMTHAAKFADIVLPCVSYYEEEADLVGSWNNWWLQYRKQAIQPLWEAKSDWNIFKGLCQKMGIGADWQMTAEECCKYILENAVDPIFNGISWNDLKHNGVVRALIDDPHIPFKDLRFPTPSGKIELYTESLKEFGQEVPVFIEPLESNRKSKAKEYPLTIMNVHHVNSAHSQHTILPWICEIASEPYLKMHPKDAAVRNIKDGDVVNVYNDRGNFKVKVDITESIKAGVLSLCEGWWPEHFVEGHFSDITHMTINQVQDAIIETNYAFNDNLVEVKKEVNYHPQGGWPDFEPLKGGEKS
jgi:molybdopterin-containing oxidoreductase family molybdopterin binding subunit